MTEPKEKTLAFHGASTHETQNEAVINHLLAMNPRKVRKILEIALGFAHAEKANELSVEDIKKPSHLLSGDAASKGTFGFL